MNRHVCAVTPVTCPTCGMPKDAEYFDEAGFADVPKPGGEALLARFELRHQYCGVLEFFAQYTDEFFGNAAAVETKGLEWRLLVNGRPLSPYTGGRRDGARVDGLEAILNPWGFGSFGVRLRLPEAARLEFIARRRPNAPDTAIKRVGGRISGRYWFNPA